MKPDVLNTQVDTPIIPPHSENFWGHALHKVLALHVFDTPNCIERVWLRYEGQYCTGDNDEAIGTSYQFGEEAAYLEGTR